MAVDQAIQQVLDQMNALNLPPLENIPAHVYREYSKKGANPNEVKEEVRDVQNVEVPLEGRTIPVRIYTPLEGQAPYPTLVFFHGGGWVIGDLDSHDAICRHLANGASCKVIAVDYRLAPEHKFPAAVDDAYDVFNWVVEHAKEYECDPERLAVGGDSAGGNLAAVTAIREKEAGRSNILFQWLIYPSTGIKNPEDAPSLKENREGYLLSAELMEWFRVHYYNHSDEATHPYVAPVLFKDHSGLPPALIATAQYDPLRDIGKTYADTLEQAGVDVTYKNYDTLIHGFLGFYQVSDDARKAFDESIEGLKHAFEDQ